MAMVSPQRMPVALVFLVGALALVTISTVHATVIDIVNSCTEDLTACKTDNTSVVECYALSASGGSYSLDVGSTWTGGVIWAFPASQGADNETGIRAKPQANLAEITTVAGGQDSYDISNVNAYNLGMEISLTSIAGNTNPTGTTCTTISCSINDLANFCQLPNKLTGAPGEGCYNIDGPPSTVATSGTLQFASACPNAYSYSTDNGGHVYGCPTTSNYQVKFCP